jgi:hypothetical protein
MLWKSIRKGKDRPGILNGQLYIRVCVWFDFCDVFGLFYLPLLIFVVCLSYSCVVAGSVSYTDSEVHGEGKNIT